MGARQARDPHGQATHKPFAVAGGTQGLLGEHGTPESAGPFTDSYRWELCTCAHVAGRLDEAFTYLSAIAANGSLIGASALLGLAKNALRR
jgi:hypothetical protein